MRKIAIAASALALALALAACAAGEFAVESNDDGVHAVATGSAEGSATANITIGEGEGICFNHIVSKGSFHAVATSKATGETVFDADLTNNIADLVDVEPGDYDLILSANGAEGTIDVIAYDKEAQAQAEESLPEALAEAVASEDGAMGASSGASSAS